MTDPGDDAVPIDVADVPRWAATVDVLVMGHGMAGVSAALGAREVDASVLILERSSGSTGTTTTAAGHFYLGGGTAVQEACGFADSADDVAAYLTAVSADPDIAKIAAFAAGGVAHFDWLEAHGVPFDRSYYPHKAVVQPGRDCLIWTGNERIWPYRELARPAPRGHKVAYDGEEGGGSLALARMADHARRAGVKSRFDVKVDGIVRDGDRTIGLRVRRFGETLFFRARRGVVLAGGGFGRNPAMVGMHLPRFTDVNMVGGPYDDGRAIELGIAAGGAVDHMDGILVTSPIYPPEQLVKGILVNRDGRRFVGEDSYHTRTSIAVADQPGGIAYLILDSDIFAYPAWHEHANQRLVDGFATIADMEAGLELPAGALAATMAAYDRHAMTGADPDFHKHPDWLKPLTSGPWAAFDVSFGRAVYNAFTLGGLRISVDAEVLDAARSPCPGLYAAGACAAMLAQTSHDYASGLSLSAASFFGRRAGRHAGGGRPPAA